MPTERFRIDPVAVVHETVDGEVILVALQTGCYYSLEGSGAELWAGLLAGRSVTEMTAELAARYSAEPGAIATAVAELVGRLADEGLAIPLENGDHAALANGSAPAGGAQPNGSAPAGAAPATAPAFPPPVLHKFTDMQDFLLADPIHDVDDAGWPHAAAAR